jgi:XTP/dITP diphosphohydrolase
MKHKLVVATKNKKKLREIKEILKGMPLSITSLADYQKPPKIVENGRSFTENAIKKAVRAAKFSHALTLGEDSGLCVHALGGAPGVRSARFSGRDKNDDKNNAKLLVMLAGLPPAKRRAFYACAVALADTEGLIGVVEGRCSGVIAAFPCGRYGFGYDPVFVIPRYAKTFAQLGPRIKHSMSHRFRALKKAKRIIQKYIEKQKRHGYN